MNAQSKPHDFMHFIHKQTHFSDHRSRLLPSPTTHAMSVRFLLFPSGCVVVLPLWQALWNWQHDLYSRTNMPGNISSHDMAGETPGNACDCVSCTFRLNCRAVRSGWAATGSTSHSRALCLVWWWLSFYAVASKQECFLVPLMPFFMLSSVIVISLKIMRNVIMFKGYCFRSLSVIIA